MNRCGGKGQKSRILLTATLGLLLGCVSDAQAQNSSASTVDLNGKLLDPLHVTPGKVVVLLFVRTDCPISNRYAPTVQELSARFKDKAAFYLVYPVKSESTKEIQKHLKDFGYRLPAVRDPGLALVRQSKATITPESAVFSREGNLLYHGRIDDWYEDFTKARRAPTTHELADAIEAAIQGKEAAKASVPAVGCYLPEKP
jgi:thiol-disulfide isomerase/thioredoxin